jgi:hypothetical protein
VVKLDVIRSSNSVQQKPFTPTVANPFRRSPPRLRVYCTSKALYALGWTNRSRIAQDPDVQHVRLVKWATRNLPQPVRRLLADRGWIIAAVTNIGDLYPHKDEQERAQFRARHGCTQEDAFGLCHYEDKVIVVSERGHVFSSPAVKVANPQQLIHTLQHEVGHAIDKIIGTGDLYSNCDEFKSAFAQDSAALKFNIEKEFWWLRWTQSARCQTFANLFCTSSTRSVDSEKLEKWFPRCTNLLKKRLKDIHDITMPPDETWIVARIKHERFFVDFVFRSAAQNLKSEWKSLLSLPKSDG